MYFFLQNIILFLISPLMSRISLGKPLFRAWPPSSWYQRRCHREGPPPPPRCWSEAQPVDLRKRSRSGWTLHSNCLCPSHHVCWMSNVSGGKRIEPFSTCPDHDFGLLTFMLTWSNPSTSVSSLTAANPTSSLMSVMQTLKLTIKLDFSTGNCWKQMF